MQEQVGVMPRPRQQPDTDARRMENRNIPNVYWAKGPKEPEAGYIIVGPGLETKQAEHWQKAGRIPLREYSYTDRISPKTGKRETIEWNEDKLVDEDGSSEYMYYWFFVNGGGKLFPVQQIVDFKWHIWPPMGLSTDAFPQLQEYEIPPSHWCHQCSFANPFQSAGSLLKHLMVGHGLDRIAANVLLKDALNKPEVTSAAPVFKKKEQPEAEPQFICNECGKALQTKLALAGHSRSHRPQPSGVSS